MTSPETRNTPVANGFGARLDQKYPPRKTRQRRNRAASGEGRDPAHESCFSEFSAISGRAFHDTNFVTLSRRNAKGWVAWWKKSPGRFAFGSAQAIGFLPITNNHQPITRATEGSDYPTTAFVPSTPAGLSSEAACSFKMAREITSFCISLVPSYISVTLASR